MIRRTTALTVATVVWLALGVGVGAAAAQTPVSAPPAAAQSVTVDLSDVFDPTRNQGVLVRTGDASSASLLAVYVGLSVVGVTLGAITVRRRYLALKAHELVTGVVIGRRARTEFWNPVSRSAVPMLVRSAEAVAMTEHGPPVRAGHVGGASYG